MEFAIARTTRESMECVEVRGEVDLHTAPAVIGVLRTLFEEGAQRVILDLSAVTFLDSSGIGVVVVGFALAREHHAGFACVQGSHLEKFARMGLADPLPLVESHDAAMASLRAD